MELDTWIIILQIFLILSQFIFLIVTYRITISQFKKKKASEYFERFLSRDVFESRITVDRLTANLQQKDLLNYFEEDTNKNELHQFIFFANFFQELGVAYLEKLVDKSYTMKVFDFLICDYWSKMHGWVSAYRELKKDETLYSKWEYLQHEIKKLKNK